MLISQKQDLIEEPGYNLAQGALEPFIIKEVVERSYRRNCFPLPDFWIMLSKWEVQDIYSHGVLWKDSCSDIGLEVLDEDHWLRAQVKYRLRIISLSSLQIS